MKKPTLTDAIQNARRTDWPVLYESSQLNGSIVLRKDSGGKLHLIQEETTLDGKRFDLDVDVGALAKDSGIDWKSGRRGMLIFDRVIDPITAAKFCVEDSVPDALKKFVHVHA